MLCKSNLANHFTGVWYRESESPHQSSVLDELYRYILRIVALHREFTSTTTVSQLYLGCIPRSDGGINIRNVFSL